MKMKLTEDCPKGFLFVCLVFAGIIISACAPTSFHAPGYSFPRPVDTESKPIQYQEKKVYSFPGGISVDNQFEGSRLNAASLLNDSTLRIVVLPENEPINPSPWYAFRMTTTQTKRIWIQIDYSNYKHRYLPKWCRDGVNWENISSPLQYVNQDSSQVLFSVDLVKDTVWIAAQDVVNSKRVNQWCEQISNEKKAVHLREGGRSVLGRNIPCLDIFHGSKSGKPLIVVLSRQHPPEVTGYFAMQKFVDEVLSGTALSQAFLDKYRVLVFPLMNPDGVDLGHWRHNAGGIDLNRDWAEYHQPETRQVADFIVSESRRFNSKVLIGLDFHSTWYDIFYTNVDSMNWVLPGFKEKWLKGIKDNIPENFFRERPSGLGQPVTKGWFYTTFKAIGITYEIGDDSPRELLAEKGKISAQVMMELLLSK